MTATAQQAVEIFERLNEQEQDFALTILKQLSEAHENDRKGKNDAYLAKIRRGIRQCAEGRGIVRDIVEAEDDE